MTSVESTLLFVFQRGIISQTINKSPECDRTTWEALLQLALENEVLPLVYDTASSFVTFHSLHFESRKEFRDLAIGQSIRQIIQTNEFLTLLLHAQSQGLDPVVLKGISVRSLYPKPYLRPSVDEDILVPRDQARAFYDFLLSEGLTADDPDLDPKTAHEISFHRPESPTYIEMHLELFDHESAAYGDMNELFRGIWDRTVRQQIEDVSVRTLHPTDHLLYLLGHAYKHFLHSGIGIRQVADIGVFSKAHAEEIDWAYIEASCRKAGVEKFAAAIFQIIQKHLIPELKLQNNQSENQAINKPAFSSIRIDEEPLLEDILSGGIYGLSDPDRVHSVNITLNEAEAAKTGKKRAHGVMRSLFPGAKYLQKCFPYAKAHPILTPVAWAHRIVNYVKRTPGVVRRSLGTVREGKKRSELMKKYGIGG